MNIIKQFRFVHFHLQNMDLYFKDEYMRFVAILLYFSSRLKSNLLHALLCNHIQLQ